MQCATPDGRRVARRRERRYGWSMANPDVVLLTKADCHLCAAARDAVGRVTAGLGLSWSERQLDDDDELRDRYAEEIPVVLVDGIQRDFWKIDEARLERVLRRALAGE
jgi:Glutaredoxin-like domain (DUF836)